MIRPRFRFAEVLEHEIHVTEWGNRANPAIVLWHGLLRTGRDFDELAAALAERYFVICPDTIGRGLSSWSSDPMAEYTPDYYTGIATDLLDDYGIERAGWIGTSMGGLVGMRIASGPLADRLSWLVVNDVAPVVPDAALERIVAYGSRPPVFHSMSEAEAWFRAAYAPFGDNSDVFWNRIARTSVRRCSDGRLTTHYDPQIIAAMAPPMEAHEKSWQRWEAISMPTHVVYGDVSDLVSEDLAQEMAARGPRPGLTKVAGTGHAPTLTQPAMITKVKEIVEDLRYRG